MATKTKMTICMGDNYQMNETYCLVNNESFTFYQFTVSEEHVIHDGLSLDAELYELKELAFK